MMEVYREIYDCTRAGKGRGMECMIDEMPGLLVMGRTIDELLASLPEAVGLYREEGESVRPLAPMDPVSIQLELAA